MRLIRTLPIAAILANFFAYQPGWAQDNAALEQRLESLEQQVAILKRQIENNKDDSTAQAAATPVVTANAKDGFSIKSPDNNFALKIGGYTQIEGRTFAATNKEEQGVASSIIPRRARLIIQGTVAHDFDFFLQPDFGYNNTYSDSGGIISSSPSAYSVALQDAWIDWKHFPDFVIKAGKMKTPFDLENLQDTRYTSFVELGLTGNLTPQRDVGATVGGNLYFDWIQYSAGIFGGAADKENGYGGYNNGGNTNSRNGVGRIFISPFKDTSIEPLQGFGIGYAVSYGKEKGTDLPTYVSPGQAPVFAYNTGVSAAGPQLRTEPQAYYYYKSLGILGEKIEDYESLQYKAGSIIYRDKPNNMAYNVEASYVLTGEDASYSGVVPRHDFNPANGQWGAFELVGRYGELKLDGALFSENFANLNTSISKENAWAAGINWYLNRNVKLAFAYEQTKFTRGAAVTGDSNGNRKTENLFTGLAQLSF
jgi:phosphate-selective porin OprO/OprP